MPPETTNVTEQFAYSGAFSISALVGAGVLLATVVFYLAWRDGLATRSWLTPVLTLLRVVAIAVVLWMLAAPSIVKTVTHTRTKSVAVIVDTSGSMGVTDPADEPQAQRWTQAASGSSAPADFVKLDEATAVIAVANSQLGRLSQMPANAPSSQVRDLVAQVQ